jgi:hypothetical protein
MDDVGIFYGHVVYFVDNWYILWKIRFILWSFDNFFPFWYVVPRKIWQPLFALKILTKISFKRRLISATPLIEDVSF